MTYGFTVHELKWLHTYFFNHAFSVQFGVSHKMAVSLQRAVSQESVLCYSSCTWHSWRMLWKDMAATCHHMQKTISNTFAVDLHNDATAAAKQLEWGVSAISDWTVSSRLKLNHTKTKLLWFSTPQTLKKCSNVSITVDSAIINPVSSARSLSVVLDSELKLARHVLSVCRSCYYQCRQSCHILISAWLRQLRNENITLGKFVHELTTYLFHVSYNL